jgi:hypothetical protein
MTSGVLLFAHNNEQIDYVAQACFLAKRITKYLNLPTTLVTDDQRRVEEYYDYKVFDNIIVSDIQNKNKKTYHDGSLSKKILDFKNFNRSDAYNISPYEKTLVMDTDYIISNNLLANCFESSNKLMMYSNSMDISGWRDETEFKFISETSIKFYWATCVYFVKDPANLLFFNLIKHIQRNYQHYRNLYQITSTVFRNDYAFSIAAHITGHVKELPGKMIYSTHKDILQKIDESAIKLLVEKQDRVGEYTLLKSNGINLHVMNKFSLNREVTHA